MNKVLIGVVRKMIPQCLRDFPLARKLWTWVCFHTQLSRRLRRQLSLAEGKETSKSFAGKRVLVPIIETSHYQHQHILGIAKALQLRGAEVKVLICGEVLDGCEIKSVRKEGDPDPCWSCRFHAQHTTPLYGLETVTLADFVSASEREQIQESASEQVSRGESIQRHGIHLDQAVQDSEVRFYYGAVPAEAGQVTKVRQAQTMSAMLTAEAAYRIDQQWHPDIVFCNMSCYSAWNPFYKYYRNNGNRFRMISLTPFDFKKITFNFFTLYEPRRYCDYRESRGSRKLTSAEYKMLDEFVRNRVSGKSEIFLRDAYYKQHEDSAILRILAIKKNKRNIFLFSNIYWDVGISEMADLYSDVVSWVLATIELLKNKPTVHLYIKPHPAEVFDSASSLKSVSQFVREKYSKLPENVTFIEPELKIKTYDLFPHIDLGVIFTGTLGLEMMMAGIPVVSTGATTHYGLGFAAEPKTEAEYLALLLGEKEMPTYRKEDLELFAYFYFIRTCIPWKLTKKAYGDCFDGFSFESLDDLLPGKDPQLDHLCNCIMDLEHTVAEAWPDSEPHTVQSS